MKGDMIWALLFVKYGVPILAFIALIGALYLYFLGSHAAKTFDPVLQMFLDVLDRIMLPKTKHWSETPEGSVGPSVTAAYIERRFPIDFYSSMVRMSG